MEMKILKDITGHLEMPILLAGWPGMGSVGVGAIDYLRRKLNAAPFAEVDMREYFTAEAVMVEDGIAKLPDLPTHMFHYVQDPPLIIFQSEAQIGGTAGINLMGQILNLAQNLGVETLYTGAAYQVPISHRDDVQVLCVANGTELRDNLVPYGVEILPQGLISGLNGLLLAFAEQRNIPAACLLATMPYYAATIPNPKASREIVRVLERVLDIDVDMDEIDEAVEKMEETMGDIEGQIQKVYSSMENEEGEGEDLGQVDRDQVPQYVMKRIEDLFLEVSSQQSSASFRDKANALKRELDRWNLYHFYEDRFLNLFRSDSEGGI